MEQKGGEKGQVVFLFAGSHPRWGQRRIDCRVICNNKGGSPNVWTSDSYPTDTYKPLSPLSLPLSLLPPSSFLRDRRYETVSISSPVCMQ